MRVNKSIDGIYKLEHRIVEHMKFQWVTNLSSTNFAHRSGLFYPLVTDRRILECRCIRIYYLQEVHKLQPNCSHDSVGTPLQLLNIFGYFKKHSSRSPNHDTYHIYIIIDQLNDCTRPRIEQNILSLYYLVLHIAFSSGYSLLKII